MKILIYIVVVLAVLLIVSQIWAQGQTKNIEMYPYEVIKEYDGFETRNYAPANFIYVTMEAKEYKDFSSEGFGQLAGYIFGGNETGEKIAMTSPVEMEMKDKVTMKFLVPSEYEIEKMPKPNNASIQFKEEPAKKVAAIRFGGFADDEKIEFYKEKLFAMLKKEGVAYNGTFSFMGYDPPFSLINRRNEVVVELLDPHP